MKLINVKKGKYMECDGERAKNLTKQRFDIPLEELEQKLSKFNYKEVSLNDDYEYAVEIKRYGRKPHRCHRENKDKEVVHMTSGRIRNEDTYKVYAIDVGKNPYELLRKFYRGLYKILLIVKIENGLATLFDYFLEDYNGRIDTLFLRDIVGVEVVWRGKEPLVY